MSYPYQTIIFNGKEYLNLCKSSEIYEGKGKRFVLGDDSVMQVAVFRVNGKLYCLSNICPHRHQDQIFEGIIHGLTVMCPVHGWTYSLETGENIIKKQGIGSLSSFEIFEKNDSVFIEVPVFKIPAWRLPEESQSPQ